MKSRKPVWLYGIITVVLFIGLIFATGMVKIPPGYLFSVPYGITSVTLPSSGGIPASYGTYYQIIPDDLSAAVAIDPQTQLQTFTCADLKGKFYLHIVDASGQAYGLNGNIVSANSPVCGSAPCAQSSNFDFTSQCATVPPTQIVGNFMDFAPKTTGNYREIVEFYSDTKQKIIPALTSSISFSVVCPSGMQFVGNGFCAPPTSLPGTLHLTSVPSGATIILDGVIVNSGTTPLDITGVGASPNHRITFRLSGYNDGIYTPFDVASGQTYSLNHVFIPVTVPTPTPTLTPTPSIQANLGEADIVTNPVGGEIIFGNMQTTAPHRFTALQPGIYAYMLTKTGYQTFSGTIEVFANQVSYINHVFTVPTPTPSATIIPTVTTTPTPTPCPQETVCGVDGITYQTRCDALEHAGGIAGTGACQNPTTTPTPTPVPPVATGITSIQMILGALLVVGFAGGYYIYEKNKKK